MSAGRFLQLYIKDVIFTRPFNFFIMGELTDGAKERTKVRTEVSTVTSEPVFKNSVFKFPVDFDFPHSESPSIILEVYVVIGKDKKEGKPSAKLFGRTKLDITLETMQTLRQGKLYDKNLRFMRRQKEAGGKEVEVGEIDLQLREQNDKMQPAGGRGEGDEAGEGDAGEVEDTLDRNVPSTARRLLDPAALNALAAEQGIVPIAEQEECVLDIYVMSAKGVFSTPAASQASALLAVDAIQGREPVFSELARASRHPTYGSTLSLNFPSAAPVTDLMREQHVVDPRLVSYRDVLLSFVPDDVPAAESAKEVAPLPYSMVLPLRDIGFAGQYNVSVRVPEEQVAVNMSLRVVPSVAAEIDFFGRGEHSKLEVVVKGFSDQRPLPRWFSMGELVSSVYLVRSGAQYWEDLFARIDKKTGVPVLAISKLDVDGFGDYLSTADESIKPFKQLSPAVRCRILRDTGTDPDTFRAASSTVKNTDEAIESPIWNTKFDFVPQSSDVAYQTQTETTLVIELFFRPDPAEGELGALNGDPGAAYGFVGVALVPLSSVTKLPTEPGGEGVAVAFDVVPTKFFKELITKCFLDAGYANAEDIANSDSVRCSRQPRSASRADSAGGGNEGESSNNTARVKTSDWPGLDLELRLWSPEDYVKFLNMEMEQVNTNTNNGGSTLGSGVGAAAGMSGTAAGPGSDREGEETSRTTSRSHMHNEDTMPPAQPLDHQLAPAGEGAEFSAYEGGPPTAAETQRLAEAAMGGASRASSRQRQPPQQQLQQGWPPSSSVQGGGVPESMAYGGPASSRMYGIDERRSLSGESLAGAGGGATAQEQAFPAEQAASPLDGGRAAEGQAGGATMPTMEDVSSEIAVLKRSIHDLKGELEAKEQLVQKLVHQNAEYRTDIQEAAKRLQAKDDAIEQLAARIRPLEARIANEEATVEEALAMDDEVRLADREELGEKYHILAQAFLAQKKRRTELAAVLRLKKTELDKLVVFRDKYREVLQAHAKQQRLLHKFESKAREMGKYKEVAETQEKVISKLETHFRNLVKQREQEQERKEEKQEKELQSAEFTALRADIASLRAENESLRKEMENPLRHSQQQPGFPPYGMAWSGPQAPGAGDNTSLMMLQKDLRNINRERSSMEEKMMQIRTEAIAANHRIKELESKLDGERRAVSAGRVFHKQQRPQHHRNNRPLRAVRPVDEDEDDEEYDGEEGYSDSGGGAAAAGGAPPPRRQGRPLDDRERQRLRQDAQRELERERALWKREQDFEVQQVVRQHEQEVAQFKKELENARAGREQIQDVQRNYEEREKKLKEQMLARDAENQAALNATIEKEKSGLQAELVAAERKLAAAESELNALKNELQRENQRTQELAEMLAQAEEHQGDGGAGGPNASITASELETMARAEQAEARVAMLENEMIENTRSSAQEIARLQAELAARKGMESLRREDAEEMGRPSSSGRQRLPGRRPQMPMLPMDKIK